MPDPTVKQRPMPGPRAVRPAKGFAPWAAYAAILALLSITVYGSVFAGPGHRVYAENDDTSLFIWWFAHAADVVATWLGFGSGQANPLYTTAMNAPDGVNGAWNTSLLGLALPAAPLTWLAGPVVAYNFTVIAAPIASALCAALFVRRFTSRVPAFVAGGVYGFSTYLIAQSGGHLNLAFAVFPPIVAWVISHLVGPSRHPARHIGIVLGLAAGWQLYVSSELLAGTFLVAIGVFIALALVAWSRLAGAIGRILASLAWAVPIALALGLPLLLTMFTAPGAPRAAIRPHGVWNNDLLDPIVPAAGTLVRIGPGPLERVVGIDPAEIGMYLGPVLIAVLCFTAALLWRSRYATLVRVSVLAGLWAAVLSMGAPLLVGGAALPVPMPWQVIEHIPVFNNILPMRLAVHVFLAAALLVGLLCEWLRSPLALTPGNRLAESKTSRRVVAAALVVALVLVAPRPVSSRDITMPDFYTGAVAEHIPEGSLVKTLPRPRAWAVPGADEAMVWQATTGMHYRERGGYFIGSTPAQPVIYDANADALDRLLEESGAAPLPDGDSAAGRGAIAELRSAGVEFVVIAVHGRHLPRSPIEIAQFVSAAASQPYLEIDGVYLVDIA